MSRRRRSALTAGIATLVLASGCSLFPDSGPKGPSAIDLTKGDYAVIYADMLSREAGASTIRADGSLLQSAGMSALGLENRAEGSDSIALIGERAGDIVMIGRDGNVHPGMIDYPNGTGVTATTCTPTSNSSACT